MNTKKIEIMSPVGSYESLTAAIQGGADAIYFGVGNLNMRSRSAYNFTLDDLKTIAEICKEQGIRSYLTLNTVIYDNEYPEMHALIDSAKAHGVSAVIISDIAAMVYARSIGMEVHLSTQCNITNSEALRFYAQFADVVVTARELNLSQVADLVQFIEKNQIKGPSGKLVEIEVFAHGALCMAVSGKCYLSLDNANSSANRGACLQYCRRQYKVQDYDNEVELKIDNAYIMSPKDLKTIDFIDKIIHAGVRVLKIEGRGRSAEYVKTVTQCYKEAVEAVEQGTYSKEKIQEWEKRLATVYNRGFWDGYYLGRKMGEWTERYGSQATQTKVYVGKVTNFFGKLHVAEVKIETHELEVGDAFLVIGPTTGVIEGVVTEMRVDLEPVTHVKKGEVCSISLHSTVRRGDKVYKLENTQELF